MLNTTSVCTAPTGNTHKCRHCFCLMRLSNGTASIKKSTAPTTTQRERINLMWMAQRGATVYVHKHDLKKIHCQYRTFSVTDRSTPSKAEMCSTLSRIEWNQIYSISFDFQIGERFLPTRTNEIRFACVVVHTHDIDILPTSCRSNGKCHFYCCLISYSYGEHISRCEQQVKQIKLRFYYNINYCSVNSNRTF